MFKQALTRPWQRIRPPLIYIGSFFAWFILFISYVLVQVVTGVESLTPVNVVAMIVLGCAFYLVQILTLGYDMTCATTDSDILPSWNTRGQFTPGFKLTLVLFVYGLPSTLLSTAEWLGTTTPFLVELVLSLLMLYITPGIIVHVAHHQTFRSGFAITRIWRFITSLQYRQRWLQYAGLLLAAFILFGSIVLLVPFSFFIIIPVGVYTISVAGMTLFGPLYET
jgi:hypothetical protein